MLLLITVGITGASYSWFGGLMSSQTKKPITIPPGGAYCADGDIKVYVLNNGDAAITTQDIIVAQVDGVDVKGTPFFGDMRSGLVGYWKFDEAGGTTARDSSGNNNNGDLKPLCPNCPEWKTGRSRNALNFDGVDDWVSLPSALAGFDVNRGTFGMWVKFPYAGSVNPGVNMFFQSQDSSDQSGTRFAMGRGNFNGACPTCLFFDAHDGNNKVSYSIASWPANEWHYVSFVWDSSAISIYTDGVFRSSAAYTPISYFGQTNEIGRNADSGYLNGIIDEVKIYNKAVGEVNIQPSSSGLVVNYPGVEGKHTVRVGTSSRIAEATVSCA